MAILNTIRYLIPLLVCVQLAVAQSLANDEYQIKAAFVFNFAKFVEWPAGAFKTPADPITICVLGNPFGGRLEDVVRGKQIDERRLVVRAVSDTSEAVSCQILFIAADKRRPGDILSHIKGNPTLTVGESPNFAAAGGIVGFKLENDRVRLEINLCAAERAGLRISSKLLSLASIVKEDKK